MVMSSATIAVKNSLDSGNRVFVKCEDNSERFLVKKDNMYYISTDREVKNNVIGSMSINAFASIIDNIRGYGTYELVDD